MPRPFALLATPTLRLLVLVALLCLARAPAWAAETPRKLALVVGIDQYGGAFTREVAGVDQWRALDGAANDVEALASELTRRGFEVLTLTNAAATRAGIVAAFRKHLIGNSKAGRGDVVMFHFSGHGQQVPDDNGTPDEVDGFDEALIPYDNRGLKDYSNHLRDDELSGLLAELRKNTSNIVVTLDSCHSGTATRGARKKRGHAPVHAPAKKRGGADDGASGMIGKAEADGAGYVFLAAVRADQEANEDEDPITKKPMGAFTFLLVRALRDAGPKTTYRQIVDRIGVQIVTRTSDQNPQIEGDADKVLFSGEWQTAAKYFRARPLDGDGLVPIEAGSLHGLTVGSELALFRHGDSKAGTQPLARIRIVKVELGMAWGEAAEGKLEAKGLENGTQAIEVLSQHGYAKVRVAVTTAGDKGRGAVGGLKFAALVPKAAHGAANSWDLRLSEDPGPEAKGGWVRIERSDGSSVPIPRGHNQRMDLAIAADDPNFEARIAQAIEAHHRRQKVVALENDDAGSRLEVDLRLTRVEAVLEIGPDGKKRPKITKTLGPVGKAGDDKVKVGEILQIHVENKSDRPCYFTLLELSTDGSISVLYPWPGTAGGENKLAAGAKRTLEVPFKMTPPGGAQIFKVIATEDDIDFRALEYQVKRGEVRGGSPLQRMMAEAFDGKRSEPFGYAPDKLWGTDAARIQIAD